MNDTDYVNATGTLNLRQPYRYSGKSLRKCGKLIDASAAASRFWQSERVSRLNQTGLGRNGQAVTASAAFAKATVGRQPLASWTNSGKLKLVLQKGRYGNLQSLQANVDASYSPESLDVPIIFFATSNMDFQAIARMKDNTLEIDKIQLNQSRRRPTTRDAAQRARRATTIPPQGRTNYAYGYVSIPFVWRNLGTNAPVIPSSGKVSATFQSENLDLKRLFDDLGMKAMTSGIVNARLNADGTIADLNARFDVQVRDLRNEYWPKMEPATFELNAQTVAGSADTLRQTATGASSAGGHQRQYAVRHSENCARTKVPDDTPITAKARVAAHVGEFCSPICSGTSTIGWRSGSGR